MRILASQRKPDLDFERNVEAVCRDLEDHPQVDLAVFPELFLSAYEARRAAEQAVPVDDPVFTRIGEVASRVGTAVVVGFAERFDGDQVANSAACIDSDGRLAGVYRKLQLFGANEKSVFTPGEELLRVRLAGVTVGVLICFDIEFPELGRALARAGIDLLVTPTANMDPYLVDHEIASRARALENRVPHVYVNRVGEEAGLVFLGDSKLINPDGTVAARGGSGEEILIGELEVPRAAPVDDVDYLNQLIDPPPVRDA